MLGLALGAASCERRPDVGAVIASAPGTKPALLRAPLADADLASRLLTDSVAQGLVQFDAAGQIVPGVAERWIVTDEGRTYIFRLRDMTWADGRPMRAAEVVAILRRRLQRRANNPLAPYLTALDTIVEMTPEVIQIELTRPRPDLLKLFAQPEMAIVHPTRRIGTGPMRVVGEIGAVTRLRPIPDPNRAADEQTEPEPEDDVLLIAERPAAGIARFARRRSDLFTGGTVGEFPLLTAAGIAPADIRLDPAAGFFGLAVIRRDGFLGSSENRAAIAMTIDRPAMARSFTADWQVAESLLPAALDSSSPPAAAAWQAVAAADRQGLARARVQAWRTAGNPAPELRLALPANAGGTLLWARLAADLYAIGVRPVRVAPDAEDADLRLLDAVAPFDSGRWYLDQACHPCGEAASQAIEAARLAPSLAERSRAIAAADRLLAEDVAFIPLAHPLRWSLVAQRLRTWQANDRAWHPLNGVRRNPN
ncbi:ABC transporter substrate-binding protein [Sphingomonas dokdonensis]|uniref:Putative binding protein YgiS n=1 Tax=Sphingomonas dokdonensis TaxID=344880 RepID=A0A245ZI72_9SPHN|nr:ABC transporter substrate-binding protein [Sphingomonas dokdonensis]OWK29446.1 putative binding protein YgiS precursor [Sphingomonas dokdonensis]